MLVFPKIFNPRSLKARLIGAAASGGRTVGGIQPLGEFSGGGLWDIQFGELDARSRANFMSARALEAALDNGAQPVIVPLYNRIHQPLTNPAPDVQAFSDDTLWDDGTPFTPLEIDAVLDDDAALRATTLEIDTDAVLIGGEHLSFLHAGGFGWRLYRIIRVVGTTAGVTTVEIRPPLRAAVAEGTPVNLESPRCVCRLESMETMLEMLRFGRGGPVRFIETFTPIPD